ncbi:MAG: hypothetical protein Q9202_000616 [Teloschistes flavicans]
MPTTVLIWPSGCQFQIRPHTGRTASAPRKKASVAKATTSKATPAVKKPAAKKPKTASKPKSKSKSKAKPKGQLKTKAKSAKARKKPKAKAVPKKKKKVVQTPEQKKRLAIKAYKAKALEPPKRLPSIAYQVLLFEVSKTKPGQVTDAAKEASVRYNAFDPTEREHYNHIANENKVANESEYRKWIQSYSPVQIAEANTARLALRKSSTQGKRWPKLQDERLVTRPRSPYNLFYKQRYLTGDFKGMRVAAAAKLIGAEWREMDASQKKPYLQAGGEEYARYEQEVKAVYNRNVQRAAAKAT